jgi:hypothetical protein
VLDIFENVRVLAYADDLKLYMRVSSTDNCHLFQQDLYCLQGWSCEKKYDLNAGKCKAISFSRGSKPVMFQYVIGDSDLERVDVFNDLGDSRMSVWSPHQVVHLARIERIQHNFIRFALRGPGWTTQPLPPYESRCLLLRLEVLSNKRKIAATLFVRDILCRRIESTYLADLLRFESNPYPRRRNARLMGFYHRTKYGQNELVNKAILIFNEYCGWFGFRDDESRYVYRNGFSRVLSGERSHLL